MALILGLLALPFLAWSWIRHGVEDDAIATLSIIGCAIIAAAAAAAWRLLA